MRGRPERAHHIHAATRPARLGACARSTGLSVRRPTGHRVRRGDQPPRTHDRRPLMAVTPRRSCLSPPGRPRCPGRISTVASRFFDFVSLTSPAWICSLSNPMTFLGRTNGRSAPTRGSRCDLRLFNGGVHGAGNTPLWASRAHSLNDHTEYSSEPQRRAQPDRAAHRRTGGHRYDQPRRGGGAVHQSKDGRGEPFSRLSRGRYTFGDRAWSAHNSDLAVGQRWLYDASRNPAASACRAKGKILCHNLIRQRH